MVALALMAMRPEYLMKLVTQPEGKYLITFAVINQTIGYFIISRIVKIKV
jgi:Flp pilus assembly protein TadB